MEDAVPKIHDELPAGWTDIDVLYHQYKQFCQKNCGTPRSQNEFVKWLTGQGVDGGMYRKRSGSVGFALAMEPITRH
jgi:hypothetical protein